MALRIKKNYQESNDSWVFDINGEIDLATSNNFKEVLQESIDEKMANITINCEGVSFIDSTGLGILISVLKRIRAYDYTITIENPKPNINKLLNITGLNKLFTVN